MPSRTNWPLLTPSVGVLPTREMSNIMRTRQPWETNWQHLLAPTERGSEPEQEAEAALGPQGDGEVEAPNPEGEGEAAEVPGPQGEGQAEAALGPQGLLQKIEDLSILASNLRDLADENKKMMIVMRDGADEVLGGLTQLKASLRGEAIPPGSPGAMANAMNAWLSTSSYYDPATSSSASSHPS